jgi:cbb3-type cytochrome oxidase maturation protein
MEILPLIIAVSLVLVALIAGLFIWAVRSDQFEDLEGPAWRVLQDDDSRPPPLDEQEGKEITTEDRTDPGSG